jgi:hypothetical protein
MSSSAEKKRSLEEEKNLGEAEGHPGDREEMNH